MGGRRQASERRGRRSIRHPNHDYSQPAAYFVTICAEGRARRFGTVSGGELRLNDAGRAVAAVWLSLPERFPQVGIDAFVVMPDHFHGIVLVREPLGDSTPEALRSAARSRWPHALGDIVGAFKSLSTYAYAAGVREQGWQPFERRLWQRNFHERWIRNGWQLRTVRRYILANPSNWGKPRALRFRRSR